MHEYLLFGLILWFLEISQKPPGWRWTVASRHMYFGLVSRFLRGTAWRRVLCRQATRTISGFWWTPVRRREPILVRFWCFGIPKLTLIGVQDSNNDW